MVLLSGLMRNAAVTGSADSVFTRVTARQGGRWAEQRVDAAAAARRAPGSAPAPRDPAETLGELQQLHGAGVITDEELAALRGRYGV